MLADAGEAVAPFGVGFFAGVEHVFWVEDLFGLTEQANDFFAELFF